MSLHEAISKRVKALMDKTVENGATEAEALTAAAKARELMDKYRLSMTDLEIQQEEVIKETFDRPNRVNVASVDYTLDGIVKYCGVRTWYTSRNETDLMTGKQEKVRLLTLFGLKPDVEMAYYLYEMINDAIERETEAYLDANAFKINGRKDRHLICTSFEVGMATRIRDRLKQMAEEANNMATTGSGTALVIVKDNIVQAAFDKLNLNLHTKARMVKINNAALNDGEMAGNSVNLSRPIPNRDAPNALLA